MSTGLPPRPKHSDTTPRRRCATLPQSREAAADPPQRSDRSSRAADTARSRHRRSAEPAHFRFHQSQCPTGLQPIVERTIALESRARSHREQLGPRSRGTFPTVPRGHSSRGSGARFHAVVIASTPTGSVRVRPLPSTPYRSPSAAWRRATKRRLGAAASQAGASLRRGADRDEGSCTITSGDTNIHVKPGEVVYLPTAATDQRTGANGEGRRVDHLDHRHLDRCRHRRGRLAAKSLMEHPSFDSWQLEIRKHARQRVGATGDRSDAASHDPRAPEW